MSSDRMPSATAVATRLLYWGLAGAGLGASYGGLVAVVHLLSYGRLDSTPTFALGAAGIGMGLALAAGLLGLLCGGGKRVDRRTPMPAVRSSAVVRMLARQTELTRR